MRLFFARDSEHHPTPLGTTKGKAKAKPRQVPRLAALDLLVALDSQVEVVAGAMLAQFVPDVGAAMVLMPLTGARS